MGAHPGPVCYRKGGQLAVTDANVFLGRVVPDFFPKIFGPGEDQPLDAAAAAAAFAALTAEINAHCLGGGAGGGGRAGGEGGGGEGEGVGGKTADEVAFGFVQVANEAS